MDISNQNSGTLESSIPAPALIEGKTYGNWLYDHIEPYLKGRILELGSGNGSISAIFTAHNIALHISDPSKTHLDFLSSKFNGSPLIKGLHYLDYHRFDFNEYYSRLSGVFDTVIALNMHDHGFFHVLAIEKSKFLLRNGGHLVLLAPANTAILYGSQQHLEDYKKYNLRSLRDFLSGDYNILRARYFNYTDGLEDGASKIYGLTVMAIVRKK